VFKTLVMYALQSPVNIGMILRVAEVYGKQVLFFDRYRVLSDRVSRYVISDFSTGALDRIDVSVVSSMEQLFSILQNKRIVCTSLNDEAKNICNMSWAYSDVVVLGNEYDGLPRELVSLSNVQVNIPMPVGFYPKHYSYSPIDRSRAVPPANNGRPSLNVATVAAILCCHSYCYQFSML